jgi:hypothetical protein
MESPDYGRGHKKVEGPDRAGTPCEAEVDSEPSRLVGNSPEELGAAA